MKIEEVNRIANLMRENKTEPNVNLEGSILYDNDILIFSQALKENTSVTHFNIGRGNYGDRAAEYLAEALKVNTTLQSLNVKGSTWWTRSYIEDKGAIALAESLKENNSLISLDLSNNKIGDAGGYALLDMLKTNTTIQHIYLGNNYISQNIINEIYACLKDNREGKRRNKQIRQQENKKPQDTKEEYQAKLQVLEQKQETEKQELHKKIQETETKLQAVQEENNLRIQKEVETLKQEQNKKIQTLKKDQEVKAKTDDIRYNELLKMYIDLRLEQKRRIGQFDEEFNLLKKQSEILKENLEEQFHKIFEDHLHQSTKDFKDHWNTIRDEVQYFFDTHEGDTTKIKASLEQTRQIVFGMTDLMKEHAQKLINLSGSAVFIERNKQTLAAIASEHKDKTFDDKQLEVLLQAVPEARLGYHTLVTSFNHLYMAAAIANTDYFTPEITGKAKTLKNLIRLGGKLVPSFGGYFDIAADIVDFIAQSYTEEHLKNFVNIAISAEEMNKIIQRVACEWVLANQKTPENINQIMTKNNLKKMIKVIFSGKLAKLKGIKHVTGDKKVELVSDALLNIIEGKNINEARAKATSNPAVVPPKTKAQDNTEIEEGKNTLEKFKELLEERNAALSANQEEEEEEEKIPLTLIEVSKELLQDLDEYRSALKLLGQLDKDEQELLLSNIRAGVWRHKVTEKQQEERVKELPEDLFSNFFTPRNDNATPLADKQGFWEAKNEQERNLQSSINARLTDIYEDLFKEIKIDKRDKLFLKDRLRAAVLDKTLRDLAAKDFTFKNAFLKNNVITVADHLETSIQEELKTYSKVDDNFAKRVVGKFATVLLTPSPQQTTSLQSRRKRSNSTVTSWPH